MTSQEQAVDQSRAAPAAAGSGLILSAHDLVSAGWSAGLCGQIPAPGTETSTAVRLSEE